jgi:hypothetical protein
MLLSLRSFLLVTIFFTPSSTNQNLETNKIFLLIPGLNMNSQERYQNLLSNLNYLSSFPLHNQTMISFDCLIFIYQTSPSSRGEEALHHFCQLEYFYHGSYGYYLKSILPSFLVQSGYTHVFLLLDDVRLTDTFRSAIPRSLLLLNLTYSH